VYSELLQMWANGRLIKAEQTFKIVLLLYYTSIYYLRNTALNFLFLLDRQFYNLYTSNRHALVGDYFLNIELFLLH
jgi:hypothetical protein